MIEAPRFVPARQDGLTLQPITPNHYPELPYYLRKYVLKKIRFEEGTVPESLWNQRGDFIEKRFYDMVFKLEGVRNVTRHEHYSQADLDGHDLTVDYEGFKAHVQVKSSRYGIRKFKQAIRDKYFPNEIDSSALVDHWMTENGIILVNASETRSDNEILNGSFYPQLEKIRQKHEASAMKTRIDIGQLAFSGTATPEDSVKWLEQNPAPAA
jgi:hypothetical protein